MIDSDFDKKYANFNFNPADQQKWIISEFLIADVMKEVGSEIGVDWQFFQIKEREKPYKINVCSGRMVAHKKHGLSCACCGIRATRCFLEKDGQTSFELKKACYHFNFYAETKDSLTGDSYLILMTRDHILAKSNGGSDSLDNYQTLCYNCNMLKGNLDLPIEKIQGMLFSAYRAYRSSLPIRKVQEMLLPYRRKIGACRIGVERITRALLLVSDDKKEELIEKIQHLQKQADLLNAECDRIEIEVQTTGIIPDDVSENKIFLENMRHSFR